MEHKTIHSMEHKDIQYLILHRGMMLNEVELKYGEVYPSEIFAKVPQHTLIGMVLGGWLFRGTEQDVEAKIMMLKGFPQSTSVEHREPERQKQVKEMKKEAKESLKESG